MKQHFRFVVILSLVYALQSFSEDAKGNEWGPVTNNAQMSIASQAAKNELKIGQPVNLWVRYRNISTNQTVCVFAVNGTVHDPEYSFFVMSPSGKDVSPDLKKWAPESGRIMCVRPRQVRAIEFNLSAVCKFDEVGTYKITAQKRGIWTGEKSIPFSLVSNPLLLSIVPDTNAHNVQTNNPPKGLEQ
ncbi:MAG: hypothetical protein KA236_05775 [Verrucomicrobia bacterium]|jgi:hypothetical protein|nr:hypothetical protein [Verrucomicrobiota bacterium]